MNNTSEVLTFRDKVGILMMALGTISAIVGIGVILSSLVSWFLCWLYYPEGIRPGTDAIKLGFMAFFIGAVLFKLSLLTVNK